MLLFAESAPAALDASRPLIALAGAAALLAVLGGVASRAPATARAARGGGIALCLIALGTLAGDLVGGAGPGELRLPLGPPGGMLTLALTPAGVGFLIPALLLGATSLATLPSGTARRSLFALAAALLALLGGDGLSLLLGLTGLAAVSLGGGTGVGRRPMLAAGIALAAGLFGLGGGIATPLAPDLPFAALHAAAGSGGHELAALLALAGLSGFAATLARRAGRADAPEGAGLVAALGVMVAVASLWRLFLDLAGPLPAPWLGGALLAAGAGLGLAGAWAALAGATLGAVAAGALRGFFGLALIGLGLALFAGAMDRSGLAMRGLAGSWLATLAGALGAGLLFLVADRVRGLAGTGHLEALGGLATRLEHSTGAALLAGLSLGALPPGVGFAAFRLVLAAALGAARQGGQAVAVAALLAAAAAMAIAGLGAAALLRLIGIGFLGRPRTPRAAGAEENRDRGARFGLLALAIALAGLGLVPGAAAALILGTATRGSAAPGLLALIALAGLAAALWRRAGGGLREAERWDGGRPALPAWLPFGDPASQVGATGFARPAGSGFTLPALPRRRAARPPSPRGIGTRASVVLPWLVLALTSAGLVLAALGGGG